MFHRSDSARCRVLLASGKSFQAGVKITPPDSTASRARNSARFCASFGGWRSKSRERAKVLKSWSSGSLRSVSTTMVGFAIAGSRMMHPA